MSSSGVIYAIIVGAWAIYLVPMWLRREDELNRARDTQRYAAAIKVLAHKEAFERRWAQAQSGADEADEALPLAAGQGVVSAPRTVKRAVGASKATASAATDARSSGARPHKASTAATTPTAKLAKRPIARTSATAASAAVVAATTARNVVTATIAEGGTGTGTTPAPRTSATGGVARPKSPRTATATRTGAAAGLGTRTGLMARRRRVVAALFALSTLGTLVSADLGAQYLWAMAVPAVLLSAYIARLRRDERLRVAARAAKRAAARKQKAREAELAREDAARTEAAQADAARAETRAEAEQRRRAEAARRRASAAARSRAQAFAHEATATDLRQASNG